MYKRQSLEQSLGDVDLTDGGFLALALFDEQVKETQAAIGEKSQFIARTEQSFQDGEKRLGELKSARAELKRGMKKPSQTEPADLSLLQEESRKNEQERRRIRTERERLLTHLAGNRRALEEMEQVRGRREAMESEWAGLRPLEPVSYTHLDVYKRQPPGGCRCHAGHRHRHRDGGMVLEKIEMESL